MVFRGAELEYDNFDVFAIQDNNILQTRLHYEL